MEGFSIKYIYMDLLKLRWFGIEVLNIKFKSYFRFPAFTGSECINSLVTKTQLAKGNKIIFHFWYLAFVLNVLKTIEKKTLFQKKFLKEKLSS